MSQNKATIEMLWKANYFFVCEPSGTKGLVSSLKLFSTDRIRKEIWFIKIISTF